MATVSIENRDNIALVWVDNPPVNALSHSVREGLKDAMAAIANDDTIDAAVIACRGRTFIAGADIREFGAPPKLHT